jgi:hypothetical protein
MIRKIKKMMLVPPIILSVMSSGSSAGILRPMADFDYTPQIGQARAHFRVPPGWNASPNDPKNPHHATLSRTLGNQPSFVEVAIDFHHIHSFVIDKTQQSLADEYLDGIRRHADPNVEVRIVNTFHSAESGALNVYRYYSASSGQRWVVFIVKGDYDVQVEIYAHELADTALFASYLEQIAQGISIETNGGLREKGQKGSKKKHLRGEMGSYLNIDILLPDCSELVDGASVAARV